ncbi:prophage PSSB64-02 [Pseudomonas mediterranea CFBP 5447]|uniref:Uncharacterized protein n=1 Tax=Pseudomonas mediterranea TaxID=183795 RepID=A0AAX2DEE1_9PSED|nr:prophage PSSB64-02 [Pseudomonas mediterranea CFBP 5447]SDU62021.1 hypothetical protein SAMN05216476_3703 [Pseudomonas mediterranea]
MTKIQRLRRIYTWRGSAIVLLLCTAWMLTSAYAGRITS